MLVASDSADTREDLRRLLGERWDVEAVGDGLTALKAAQDRPPDVIVADVVMPELDGFELIRALRVERTTGIIPVILLSARAGEDARVEGIEAGADDYLVTPVSARELVARVSMQVELTQLRGRLAREQIVLDVFQQSPVPIAILQGPTLVFESVNAAYVQVVGGRDVTGKPLLEAVPEFRSQGVDAMLVNVMRSGVPHVGREVLLKLDRRGDGTLEDTYWTFLYAPLRDARGRVERVVAICNEVTEEITARERLRTSEQRLGGIFRQATVGIAQTDFDGRFIFVNDRYCAIVGRSRDALLRVRMHDVTHPDDLPANAEQFRRLAETGEDFVVEKRYVRPDGSEVWVRNSVFAVQDLHGARESIVAVSVDVTGRRRAEDALRESEARLAAELADSVLLSDISAEIVHEDSVTALYEKIMDAAVRIMRSDFASMQMLYPERGAAGELRLLAFRGFDAEAARFWEWVRADSRCSCGLALRTRRRVVAADVARCDFMAGSDDQAAYLQAGILAVQSTPLISRTGRLLGMISTHWRTPHEPSERDLRLLDILARQAADFIERRQTEDALRNAKAGAEVANRAKDEFIANLSHELRTPLTAMVGWTRLLRASLRDPDVARRALDVIERNVDHQVRLIADLLDISRIISGKLTVDTVVVDLAEVVTSVVDTMRPAADARSIGMTSTLAAAPVWVEADTDRLRQVVGNLLSNAVKFTPHGGRIVVRLERTGERARLSVSDSGKGIDPDFLPHIFDRFRQSDTPSARPEAGLGLGLAIVRHLVELHRGTVRVESDGAGKGSTFTVDLPVVTVGAVAAPAAPAIGPHAGTRLDAVRIVLVEDDTDSRELFGTILSGAGAAVEPFETVRDALEAIRLAPPDLVVCDLAMPGDDGFALIRALRSWSPHDGARIPALAVTAYARPEDRARALAAGFDGHLEKPVEPGALVDAVGRLARARG